MTGNRGAAAYENLGPFYDASTLGLLVELRTQSVEDMVRDGEIICLITSDGDHLYPAFQFFGPGLTPLPDLALVLAALDPRHIDSWGDAIWLREPRPELGGHSPAEALRQGGTEDVVGLANQAGTLTAP
ncbi:DUF2384 domain-containing protein [Frigoribacterium sp. NBH87]|uniref:antitoxin Xre/MbcA/ParS toxin-binding domain-containing protein n=1 Tax=Frigoribacterium sp. NBH87 TaxID=2596916 RepID=UPI00162A7844|nr:antitoxin Xre/MbcA/ParS toxin-binding domain-containing protein [Frigoribacterium sp. NBH87]QNE42597.1 DUF2384 domain-containing protein [Frigoribacterium sp. NBH87]